MSLPRGQLVLLIGTDDFMPPLGSVGEVVSGPDWMDDYLVHFPGHPCPVFDVADGVNWWAARSWLTPLDPLQMQLRETAEELHA